MLNCYHIVQFHIWSSNKWKHNTAVALLREWQYLKVIRCLCPLLFYSISQEICTRFLLCCALNKHWLIFPYPSGVLHWHYGNLTIAPVPAKQPWWIWINTSCELIMNDCITTTTQSTTKPCAYFLGYTVCHPMLITFHKDGFSHMQHGYLIASQTNHLKSMSTSSYS